MMSGNGATLDDLDAQNAINCFAWAHMEAKLLFVFVLALFLFFPLFQGRPKGASFYEEEYAERSA